MTIDSALTENFCLAYATGVINFILSEEPQTVVFDAAAQHFRSEELFAGTSPTDVTVWIGDSWRQMLGSLNVSIDPSKPDFSVEALKSELVARLQLSSDALTLCRQLLTGSLDA